MRRDASFCLAVVCFLLFAVALLWTASAKADEAEATPEAAKPAPVKLPADHAARMEAGLKLFASDVRPLLIEKCVHCHSGAEPEAEFDMTTREAMLRGGTAGAAVELWNAKASLLVRLIKHEEEPTMPQEASKMSDDEIASIVRWIDSGAPYDQPLVDPKSEEIPWTERVVADEARDYWAFRPLAKIDAPRVQNEKWVRNPIDRFILARLEQRKLHPNAAAERRVLARRAYFDLVGMPPAPEVVEAYVNDPDPRAYEKLIDSLLDSPQYGERWARHWLDVARFGESEGGEHDYDRPHAYHYRDFVIRALNDDIPFDQFIRWQIAGDELAPDDPQALAATGFLVAGTFPTQLTEREFEPARYDQMDDMASTTSAAFLGLSVGCARCHDHKFDPILARDYYQFLSTFSQTIRSEINVDLSSPQEREESQKKFNSELARLEQELKRFDTQTISERFAAYVKEFSTANVAAEDWLILDVASHETESTTLQRQTDGSLLAVGNTPGRDTYTLSAVAPAGQLTGLRLEALSHASLPRKGPGLAANGNFCLSDLQVSLQADGGEPVVVELNQPRVTHQQNAAALSAAASLDADKQNSGWAVDAGGIGKDQAAAFAFAKPVSVAENGVLTVTLRFHHSNGKHALGCLRLAVTQADIRTVALQPKAAAEPAIPSTITATIEALQKSEPVSAAQLKQAQDWFATSLPERATLLAALEKHKKSGPAKHLVKMQVGGEGLPKLSHHANGRGYPHFYPETYFLKRGDTNEKQGVAEAAYLQVLLRDPEQASQWQIEPPAGSAKTYRRAALAHWMTDVPYGAGSLAARVAANRLWLHHFGRGIVPTPNDFGKSGTEPTHPELLEWLAGQLVAGGWRLKPLHKLMMTSSAYMQSSEYDAPRAAIDPENSEYWRRDIVRLEAEAIRDSMLAVSGQLEAKMYGPGERNEAMKRRSIYFFVKRSQIPSVLQLFDLPEPLVSQGLRPATTIAPQSLLFMNNPQVQGYAKAMARRISATPGVTQDEWVREAFRLALSRDPTASELQRNTAFLAAQEAAYQSQGKQAAQTALADLCQVMFCLNEFIYVP